MFSDPAYFIVGYVATTSQSDTRVLALSTFWQTLVIYYFILLSEFIGCFDGYKAIFFPLDGAHLGIVVSIAFVFFVADHLIKSYGFPESKNWSITNENEENAFPILRRLERPFAFNETSGERLVVISLVGGYTISVLLYMLLCFNENENQNEQLKWIKPLISIFY